MSNYYEDMPEDFKNAVEIIKKYCQFENCDEVDCDKCPFPLKTIRCGDSTEK